MLLMIQDRMVAGAQQYQRKMFMIILFILFFVRVALFTPGVEHMDVIEGDTVDFTCQIGIPCHHIVWSRALGNTEEHIATCSTLHTANIYRDKFKVSLLGYNLRLRVYNVTQGDSNYKFTCYEAADNWRNLKIVKLIIHRPSCYYEMLTELSENQVPTEIHCNISIASRLAWFAPDGSELTHKVTTNNSVLTVNLHLNESDNYAQFKCAARRTETSDYSKTSGFCTAIPLQIPPKVKITPEILNLNPGQHATFNCNARVQFPQNNYEWIVNGTVIIPTGSHGRYMVDREGTRFTIRNVNPDDNYLRIKCKANNGFQTKGSKQAVLYVASFAPTVSNSPVTDPRAAPGTTQFTERSTVQPKPGTTSLSATTHHETTQNFLAEEGGKGKPGHTNAGNNINFVLIGGSIGSIGLLLVLCVCIMVLVKRKTNKDSTQRQNDPIVQLELSKRPIPHISNNTEDIASTSGNEVLYALPLQKGGGNMKVKTLDPGDKTTKPMMTTNNGGKEHTCKNTKTSSVIDDKGPVYALPLKKGSGKTVTTTDTDSSQNNVIPEIESSDTDNTKVPSMSDKEDAVYALPVQKGGGNVRVRPVGIASKVMLSSNQDNESSDGIKTRSIGRVDDATQLNVEGLTYADINFPDSGHPEGRTTVTSTETSVYAEIRKTDTK